MAFEIVNDIVKGIPFIRANAFGGRMMPTAIVCHDTADPSKADILRADVDVR